MNEIAKINDEKRVAIADPFSLDTYHDSPDGIISSMIARKMSRVNEFDRLGDLADAPLEAVRECRRAIEDDDTNLKGYEKKMLDALLELSGFKSVVVQMKGPKTRIDPLSVRGKFAEMIKALKAREDAEKIPEPTHEYVVRFTTTDSGLKKILEEAKKVADAFTFANADGQAAKVDTFFDSIN